MNETNLDGPGITRQLPHHELRPFMSHSAPSQKYAKNCAGITKIGKLQKQEPALKQQHQLYQASANEYIQHQNALSQLSSMPNSNGSLGFAASAGSPQPFPMNRLRMADPINADSHGFQSAANSNAANLNFVLGEPTSRFPDSRNATPFLLQKMKLLEAQEDAQLSYQAAAFPANGYDLSSSLQAEREARLPKSATQRFARFPFNGYQSDIDASNHCDNNYHNSSGQLSSAEAQVIRGYQPDSTGESPPLHFSDLQDTVMAAQKMLGYQPNSAEGPSRFPNFAFPSNAHQAGAISANTRINIRNRAPVSPRIIPFQNNETNSKISNTATGIGGYKFEQGKYHDHVSYPVRFEEAKKRKGSGGIVILFPQRLQQLLEGAEEHRYEQIIVSTTHGRQKETNDR